MAARRAHPSGRPTPRPTVNCFLSHCDVCNTSGAVVPVICELVWVLEAAERLEVAVGDVVELPPGRLRVVHGDIVVIMLAESVQQV